MKFRNWFEASDDATKRRVLAPIGSEQQEQIAKVVPVTVDFGTFKETWHLIFTEWKSVGGLGGRGRVLFASEVDATRDFEGGFLYSGEGGVRKFMYYLDPYTTFAKPFLAQAAKSLNVTHLMSGADAAARAFAREYGFQSEDETN